MSIHYVALETDSVIPVELTPEGFSTPIKRCLNEQGSGAITSHLPSAAEIRAARLLYCQLPLNPSEWSHSGPDDSKCLLKQTCIKP